MNARVGIRAAEPQDVALLFSLVLQLASYERASEQVSGSEALLEAALFGPRPVAEAVLGELDGETAGFALYFTTFSTWLCRPGIWLEDLFVLPAHRRAGVGRALLCHLSATVAERGWGRLDWSALHWNQPAIDFYEELGAQRLHEWEAFRLEGTALTALAAESPRPA